MAIALSKEKVQAHQAIMVLASFVTLFVVNAVLLYLANMLFPNSIVLGTASITAWWAIYHGGRFITACSS
jgi:hypothetical protein